MKRTPEEESGMIHPEGLTIKKMSEIEILCIYFRRPKNPLMVDLVAFRFPCFVNYCQDNFESLAFGMNF